MGGRDGSEQTIAIAGRINRGEFACFAGGDQIPCCNQCFRRGAIARPLGTKWPRRDRVGDSSQEEDQNRGKT